MIKNIFQTTFGMAYLVEYDNPAERLAIQFVPDEIRWRRSPYIVTIAVQDRNHPFYHYTGGEDVLDIPLGFYADDIGKNSAIEKVQWLNSLTYTEGSPLQKVKLVFGKLFTRQTWVIMDVSSSLQGFDLIRQLKPNVAYVNLRLGLSPDSNMSRADARLRF